ncbi:MAG: hypothetical protein HZC51_06550 [Nitrospirae bacterium]|nr:hypothetical protein [Nitrospirota bacterium]
MRRTWLTIITVIMLSMTAAAAHAITPAGTVIFNKASSSYTDSIGPKSIISNTVQLAVTQVYGIDIRPDGTTAAPGNTISVIPSGTAYLPYILTNTGNGPDQYTLTLNNLAGDSTDLSSLRVYIDTNGDGIHQAGEPLYNNLAPPTVGPGGLLYLIVAGEAPVGSSGFVFAGIDGASAGDAAKTDTGNVSRVNITTAGFVNTTKSADRTTAYPGDAVAFSVHFTNGGASAVGGATVTNLDFDGDGAAETAKGLLVSDPVPPSMTYVSGSASGIPVNGFPVYLTADGLWKDAEPAPAFVLAVGFFIPEDPSGAALTVSQAGRLDFSAVVTPGSPAGTTSNQAQVSYFDGTTDVTANTNKVIINILGRVAIAVDDTDDLGASTGTGVMTDPDDLTVITSAATGGYVRFVNEAWNLNTIADSVELRYDPASSTGIPVGLTVSFLDMAGNPLPDTDGDGFPEAGPIPPGGVVQFETRVTLPAGGVLSNVTVAVRGYSEADSTVSDLTFDRVTAALAVEIRVEVRVTVQVTVMAVKTEPLANKKLVVYEYDGAGALVGTEYFMTDASGVAAFDGNGNPHPLYNHMRYGYEYKVGLMGDLDGFTYNLSPAMLKSDFDGVTKDGDVFTRDGITVKMQGGTKILVTPLDPAGFVFDGGTAARVDGACVTFYECTDASCTTYSVVNPALLDFYPDGVTQQENPQVAGPTDAAGVPVGKGLGSFEFRFKNYVPALDGWYFITVDYGCALPASNPALAATYNTVPLNAGAVWNPFSGSVYVGEKFYIDKDFPGAILLRVPLSGGTPPFRPLVVNKTSSVPNASVGDMVEFRITAENPNATVTAYSASAVDILPRGLKYKSGSGRVAGVPSEPALSPDGGRLTWGLGDMAPGAKAEIRFIVYVGLDAGEGRLVNHALTNTWADAALTIPMGSNVAEATLAVRRGVFSEKAYVIGKVYVDDDGDRVQDPGEVVVKGAKIYTEDGRYVVTDSEGKYHIDNMDAGTHVLKLDTASLPEGLAPALTGSRNVCDPGSLFADLFPGDMYSGVFRLERKETDAVAEVQDASLTASKVIDAIFADANTDTLVVRHRVTIKNRSGAAVYEASFRMGGGHAVIDGTSYLDGSPLPLHDLGQAGHVFSFPVVEAGREMTVTFNSYLPAGRQAEVPMVTYRTDPSGTDHEAPLADPCSFYSDEPGVYTIHDPTATGARRLTPEEAEDLATIVEALRKYGYQKVVVSAGVGGSDQILAFLKDNLVDMDKVSSAEERPPAAGNAGGGDMAGGAGLKVSLVPRSPGGAAPVIPGVVPKGMYTLTLDAGHGDTDGLTDVRLFMRIPEGFSYISHTAAAGGRTLDVVMKSGFFIVGGGKEGTVSGTVSLGFLLMDDVDVKGMPFAVLGKDAEGRVLTVDSQYFGDYSDRAAEVYTGGGARKEPVAQALARTPEWRILYPANDGVASSRQTDIKVSMSIGAQYGLKVNGAAADLKLIGETATDDARGVVTIQYVGVPLVSGVNVITVEGTAGVMDKRVITVSGEASTFDYSIAPELPPADGKTPVYVIVELKDAEGMAVVRDASLDASVDKGDVFDYETGVYMKGPLDSFKVKAVAGRAVIRLSPSATTDTRTVTVRMDQMEKDIEVRWYPERRAWIIAGEVEAAMGINSVRGTPPKSSEMPFDHSKGGRTEAEAGGGVFAKGTVKDYTLTFRYKEKEDENTILQQNVPSTEEEQYYPVYGDSSEQFFEAQSKGRFFFKAERGLSYVQYGDYTTGFGRDLEFNKYERTLSGGLLNIEKTKDYMVRSFVSLNDQAMTRQTLPGRGLSGPYFLGRTDLVEFSERVWIEVRDRYNPNLILETVPMARFTDYQVNYDEGFVIFHEPVRSFDDNFNPVLIQVLFESRELAAENLMYGMRGEKQLMDGRLRVGASGVREENPISNVQVAGVDVVWKTDSLTVAAEAVTTENFNQSDLTPTSGSAYRVEADYHKDDNSLRAYYKKVTDGFQNPSATAAESAYETYGANGQISLNDKRTVVRADYLAENRSSKRVQASASVDQRLFKAVSANAGIRWNRETSGNGVLENILALYGVSFNPFETLGVTVGREDVLSGRSASTYYPTKTFARVNYAVTKNVTAFVQGEYQQREDKDQIMTSVGLDTRLGDNTTAFAKYSMDDSVSGWRNKGHIGINHVIPVSEGLSLEGGAESTLTLTGGTNDADDFTALRAGAVYTQKETYKLTGRYEIRLGKGSTDQLATIGGAVKATEDLTLFANERYFDSAYSENDLLFGAAYRPVRTDGLNALLKLRYKERSAELDDSRLIGSVNVNYRRDPKTDIMGQYACKLVSLTGMGSSFTDMVRVRVIRDLCDCLSVNAHASVMRQRETNTWSLAWGPEIGVKVVKNLWVSVGYNFSGYFDDDFEDADSWSQGPYFKVRFKFDENTPKDLLDIAGL